MVWIIFLSIILILSQKRTQNVAKIRNVVTLLSNEMLQNFQKYFSETPEVRKGGHMQLLKPLGNLFSSCEKISSLRIKAFGPWRWNKRYFVLIGTMDILINRLLIGHSWWASRCIKAMALHAGANHYTGPACSAKVCFMADGNLTTYYCQQRQAGWVNKQSMYMRY